ncbi:prepilin peptidase [Microbacterium sp. NPDC090007]|uniref:prepilin peptidase n=1 Tax=Microbacterium sp. NPDC090007 TaxID=3364204 RepID=UPI0038185C31
MTALLAAWGVFAVASAVLTVLDLRRRRLPDVVVLPVFAVSVVLLALAACVLGDPSRARDVAGGALAAFALCLLAHLARPWAFGGGDVKLAGLVGAHLGWFGAEAVASGLLVAGILGGFAAAGMWLAGARRDHLAYGPALLGGAWWRMLQG